MQQTLTETLSVDHVNEISIRMNQYFKRNIYIYMKQQSPVGQNSLISQSSKSHSDTTQSKDSPGLVISPTQRPLSTQNTITKNRHSCHRRVSYPQSLLGSCNKPRLTLYAVRRQGVTKCKLHIYIYMCLYCYILLYR